MAGHGARGLAEAWRLRELTVERLGDDVLLFHVPLPVRFKTKSGTVIERTLEVKDKAEDFYDDSLMRELDEGGFIAGLYK